MIYFSLPNFYENFLINNFFYEIAFSKPDYFKYPVSFISARGNFPYNYWNGGYNTCIGKGSFYEDVFNLNKNTSIPLRINCANILLKETDFEDSVANTILKLCEDSSNIIEISNFDFYVFLKEKYPNYKFIFSKEADLIYPFNEKIINSLNDKNYFNLISLPNRFTQDIEFLSLIQNKKNIEITVNSQCQNCHNQTQCQQLSHLNQYNFSSKNPYLDCIKKQSYHKITPLVSLEEIYNIYVPLGYYYYQIEDTINNDKDNLFIFMVNYFIKDEYKSFIYELGKEKGCIL